jgi:hypothetical protein
VKEEVLSKVLNPNKEPFLYPKCKKALLKSNLEGFFVILVELGSFLIIEL